ncbi:hypothetical protein SCALIN_C38_0020 [Candidatus Scalindua japonica]|uniref:Uncharacterized protein n=2 Tax=Candidatus Scalindua japonica TaxID=1284222 RepID=A0A286U3E6_9BACT|nr:hypothetical protein SCALIN_C38_0020 [Candidatus Scalindua japonica]
MARAALTKNTSASFRTGLTDYFVLFFLLYIVVFTLLISSWSYAQDAAGVTGTEQDITAVVAAPRGVTVGSGASLDINNGALTIPYDIINNGTLQTSTGTLEVGGNWVNTGTFTSGTGLVNLIDGQSPVGISGNSTFYNFSATTNTGKRLELDVANTQTITNLLTLQGAVGNLLFLRSSADGQQARIDLQSGGTQLIDYIDVKDLDATGESLAPGSPGDYNSVDSGNNNNWFQAIDSDGDGIPDPWEISNFGDLATANGTTDFDNDGLLDIDESLNGTNPKNTDSDGDGMDDGWEVTNGLGPLVDDSGLDPDGDGLTNLQEYNNGINSTDPNVSDLTITAITPSIGTSDGVVNITDISGSGFDNGAAVRLVKAGESDINATGVTVVGPTMITCAFDITNVSTGGWDVVVMNPDTQSVTRTNGFIVKCPTPTCSIDLIPPGPKYGVKVSFSNPCSEPQLIELKIWAEYGGVNIVLLNVGAGRKTSFPAGLESIDITLIPQGSFDFITGVRWWIRLIDPVSGETFDDNSVIIP